ncbi:MAG: DUF3786 domain-containing protein [Dehalococcoidia bacterium]|nr:MAG: DUF3786 domain-containing protein [Dehalococcoidia bacterium]
MASELLQLPFDGFQLAYAASTTIAFDILLQSDLDEVCRRSGARQVGDRVLTLPFMGSDYLINLNRRSVTGTLETPLLTDQLVILHYLTNDKDAPLETQEISFQELPEGLVYYPSFYKRVIIPLVKHFGDSPEQFISTATILGGTMMPLGDVAVCFQALPKVKLTWVIWRSDKEFPAEGTILMNTDITKYLPIEDIAVLCHSITLKLCRINY